MLDRWVDLLSGSGNPAGGECLEGKGDGAEDDLRLPFGAVPGVQGWESERQAHPACVAQNAAALLHLKGFIDRRKIPCPLPYPKVPRDQGKRCQLSQ